MHLAPLAAAAVALLLIAGCADDDEAMTPSATETPAAMPSEPGTATPPGDTPPGTVPTDRELPADVRTGVAAVDAALSALFARDLGALAGLVRYEEVACTTVQGLGGPPRCEEGEADGTVVQAFPHGACEGEWTRDALPVLERWMDDVAYIVAVGERDGTRSDSEPYWPIGEHLIILENEFGADRHASVLYFEDGALVRLWSGCGASVDEVIEQQVDEVLLRAAA
ncbi:MAG: hypothetical protein GEU73_16180 [Chloroflexi bacterium]|nr:hypothetical protein [Chloroflexota bacterium]